MSLKKESESEKAHRIFKYYKATSNFPNEMSPLESYRLLAKYHYFIAANIDKKVVNTLTEICNVLDREKVIVVFGDFLLDTLIFGLKSYKYEDHREVKLIYVDCLDKSPVDSLSNAISTGSHFKSYIIYILDNAESLKKKDIDYVCKLKEELQGSSRSVVCCALNFDSLNPTFRNCFKRFRLGNTESQEMSTKNYIYALFNNKDRQAALEIIENSEIGGNFFFNVAAHNLPHFYEKDQAGMQANLQVLEKANSMLYKVSNSFLWKYLVFSWKITGNKRVIRFPVKIESEKTSNGELNINAKNPISSNIDVKKQIKELRQDLKVQKEIKQVSNKRAGGLMRYGKR